MSFGPADLRRALEEALPEEATALAVALSGGPDSAALLAALRLLPIGTVRNLPVRALHVDHGLQCAAAQMRAASAALCERFEVPLAILEAEVPRTGGGSVEALARDVRYARLSAELRAHECLLTAHHQQDQAETVLLQLLRGAGPRGLAGMPMRRRLGPGWHIRPLLEVGHAALEQFVRDQQLSPFRDPMNTDPRFERAYLRSALWPAIETRWPGAAKALARSAAHLAAAEALIETKAAAIVSRARDGEALSLQALRGLDELEQLHALRQWIAAAGVRLPSSARLREALRQMLAAGADQVPAVAWEEHALRRYRDRLFLTPACPPRLEEPLAWPAFEDAASLGPGSVATASGAGAARGATGAALELPHGLGRLRFEEALGGLDPARLRLPLEVRRREGNERLRIARGGRTRSARELCQAWGIVPWMRDALPFVYAHRTLIAVGDLWHNADLRVAPDAPGLVCRWENAPRLQ
ncbi:MAG TPA: tRNA lysidine(34) synthetase TilS [Steroidobacteraceae bacterium]|nr:tRNA lysidine(34) synthetase TilS [Steroidobacteraceae bacterium]